jgi:hypothetical protein
MKAKTPIRLLMPDLSPSAAYAVSLWINELAHQVETYYADEIRTHTYAKGREALEMEKIELQIEQNRESEEEPDDPIPF